jgi:hypothetical protein
VLLSREGTLLGGDGFSLYGKAMFVLRAGSSDKRGG